ncbi:MAG: PilZ domain-containing protein [Oscillospiraceae bacterium]|nr:PilZ domain-containing protein [Oscillospiraceae bacterium]
MAIEMALVKVDLINADEGISISSERVQFSAYRLILYAMQGEALPILPHQTQVDIVAYYEDGVKLMWGEVSISLPGQINIEVLSNSGEKQERRRNVKVRTSFDAKVSAIESMGRRKRRINVKSDIRVRDLSLGGVGFFSDSMFLKNQIIVLDLSYLKSGFLADFQVLRREKNTGYGGYSPGFKYKYGGRVLKLTGEEERMVCEYVYKVQITDYHRRKEKSAQH